MWRVIHHEKGSFSIPAKVDDAHDMRMRQASDGARLGEKTLHVLGCQLGGQHLDGDPRLQVDMFTQVDLGEAALIKQLRNTRISRLLPYASCRIGNTWRVITMRILRTIAERSNRYICKSI